MPLHSQLWPKVCEWVVLAVRLPTLSLVTRKYVGGTQQCTSKYVSLTLSTPMSCGFCFPRPCGQNFKTCRFCPLRLTGSKNCGFRLTWPCTGDVDVSFGLLNTKMGSLPILTSPNRTPPNSLLETRLAARNPF